MTDVPATPIVELVDVSKRYGAVQALNGVSLDVNRGEVVCLIGPSGSGKSTLLRAINALDSIDGGTVVFDGIDVHGPRTDIRKVRQRMGMVFQSFELFPHMTHAPTYPSARTRSSSCRCKTPTTAPTSFWPRSAWPTRPMSIRPNCREVSSSGSRSRGRWPCTRT